jgi:uncharacterized protein YkuJ
MPFATTVNFQRDGKTVETVRYPSYAEAFTEVCDYRFANSIPVDYKYLNIGMFFVNDR